MGALAGCAWFGATVLFRVFQVALMVLGAWKLLELIGG